jgi:hypothetical protein
LVSHGHPQLTLSSYGWQSKVASQQEIRVLKCGAKGETKCLFVRSRNWLFRGLTWGCFALLLLVLSSSSGGCGVWSLIGTSLGVELSCRVCCFVLYSSCWCYPSQKIEIDDSLKEVLCNCWLLAFGF